MLWLLNSKNFLIVIGDLDLFLFLLFAEVPLGWSQLVIANLELSVERIFGNLSKRNGSLSPLEVSKLKAVYLLSIILTNLWSFLLSISSMY